MIHLKVKKDSKYRAIKHKVIYGICGIFCLIMLSYNFYQNYRSDQTHQRQLLGDGYSDKGGNYVEDAFTKSQLKSGAVILHIVGLCYVFLAIAVVCDDFFVPAIDLIVEKLDMSPDTAGATFMAAGGSAPELFTAFIGTFLAESDVGFATIVGSAVFNVLFVIGCCAVFSSGALVLTWYPFARDCLYYIMSLCFLAAFFSDQMIYWYEALILLFLYGGYVTLMMNNARLYHWIDDKYLHTPPEKRRERANTQLRPITSVAFNVSLFKLMTADKDFSEIAGVHMVSRIKGDVEATFREVDVNNDGVISKEELANVLRKLGGNVTEEQVAACHDELDSNHDGEIDFTEFQAWYIKSERRMKADVLKVFDNFDDDSSGSINVSELRNLLEAVVAPTQNEPITEENVIEARKLLDANNDGQVSREEFLNWYQSSIFFERALKKRETLANLEEKEKDGGVDLTFPNSIGGRISYILTAPIIYPLYYTVPDVSKPRWREGKWFILAFAMSIMWLGVYSYLMVWWATIFGEIVGIPSGVMGLTILAAGTSVPDLLTSVIVAREGHGDMAVSSSIGSNIFDVLIGLPLPWFLYTISIGASDGARIEVVADSLFFSILVLFVMLGAVLSIIKLNKWRMTPLLGYSMFVLYIIFVIQDLMQQYGVFSVSF